MSHTVTATTITPLLARHAAGKDRAPAAGGRSDLSLVNLAARQRMLSQRMILQTVLASSGDTLRLEEARRTLQVFTDSQQQLLATPQQLEAADARRIEAVYHGPKGVAAVIADFMRLMRYTLDLIASGDTHQTALADLVGHTDRILDALNTATTVFDEITRARSETMMRELSSIVGDIQSVAKEAKVVSFNAQIMAARAGQHGREFSVVANVLSGITGEIDDLSRKAVVLADRSKLAA
jgi:methyl-accepting chemotaxis protein